MTTTYHHVGIGRRAESDRNLVRAFLISVGAHLLLIGAYALVVSGPRVVIHHDGLFGGNSIIPIDLDNFLHGKVASGTARKGSSSSSARLAANASGTRRQTGTIPIPTNDSTSLAVIGGVLDPLAVSMPIAAQPIGIDGPVKESARLRLEASPSEEEIFDGTEPQIDLGLLQRQVIYPEIASRNGVEGRVIVKVLIDEQGRATRPRVEYSDSRLLDAAAVDAILRTHFVPGMRGGTSVPVWMTIPLEFRLK